MSYTYKFYFLSNQSESIKIRNNIPLKLKTCVTLLDAKNIIAEHILNIFQLFKNRFSSEKSVLQIRSSFDFKR